MAQLETYILADESFHPAGTFKVHVIRGVFHPARDGMPSREDRLPITNSFTSIADGSRFALLESDDAEQRLYPRIGAGESIGELTRRMILPKALAISVMTGRFAEDQRDEAHDCMPNNSKIVYDQIQ